ncbi:hypothetical protein Pelo_3879 [Pelomyxa schiedti]|nr:hypothetical protein Pelo_3879 [Pelomyxa schiedti]
MVVIFGFLMGLIVFCCERNVYTLAWSMQSSVVSFAFTMTFSVVIPLIQVFTNDGSLWWIVYIGVGSLWLTLGILMLYKAWTKGDEEEFWALPLIGKFALKQAHKRIDKKAAQKEAKKARKSSV